MKKQRLRPRLTALSTPLSMAMVSLLAIVGCSVLTGPEVVVESLELEDVTGVLSPRDTIQLTVVLKDAAGANVSADVSWSSADQTVAEVSNTGLVTGRNIGATSVVATTGTLSATVEIRVMEIAFGSLGLGGVVCGLAADGAAHCWGSNHWGQLGNGSGMNSDVPVQVSGGPSFTSLGLGSAFVCGSTDAGALYCWGHDGPTVCSLGCTPHNFVSSETPVMLPFTEAFSSISAGAQHMCGLMASGAAYCWGGNGSGQLGNGSQISQPAPVAVSGNHRFTSLAAGAFHVCGITFEGEALCWGSNSRGELGIGHIDENCEGFGTSKIPCSTVPVPVVGGLTFESLAAYWASCGLDTDGQAYCWGSGERQSEVPNPEPVADGLAFSSLSVGSVTICGITKGGATYCWSRFAGRPPQAIGGGPFVHVKAGNGSMCGLTANGAAFCWESDLDPVHIRGTIMPVG